MAKTTPIALFVLALVLVTSACASYVDKPYQRIYVTTPGAENAECILRAGKSKAIAHPPQEVTIRNNNESLAITCHTPENRVRTVRYQAEKVESPKYNIPTGYASGMNYDYVEGERYKYPERAVVIFKGIEAGPNPLPKYQYATTPSPTTAGIENFDPGRSLLPWEELNRLSSERSSSEGKNGDSESPDAPLPLPGKKDSADVSAPKQGQINQSSANSKRSDTKTDTDQNTAEQSGTTESQSGSTSDTVSTVSPTRIKPNSRAGSTRDSDASRTLSTFEARARRDARSADQKQPQSDNSETDNSETDNSKTTGSVNRPIRLYSGD